MHIRHILILTLLLLALAAPSATLAAPASKKRVKVKKPSSGGSDEVDADSGTPSMFLDYEPASVSENGLTSTGIWVPNPSSGGCLMWSTDRVTPLSNWKPACDAPRLKTWVIGVLAAVAGLLILCCCCCVWMVRRAGGGLVAVVKGVASGQGLKAMAKGKKEAGPPAAPMTETYPASGAYSQQPAPAEPHAAYPPQSVPMPYAQNAPAAYPQQQMPMPPSQAAPAAYPPQQMPMPASQAAPAAYPPPQQLQQQMPAYPPQSY